MVHSPHPQTPAPDCSGQLRQLHVLALQLNGMHESRAIARTTIDYIGRLGFGAALLINEGDALSLAADARLPDQLRYTLAAGWIAPADARHLGQAGPVLVAPDLRDTRLAALAALAGAHGLGATVAAPLLVQRASRGMVLCFAPSADRFSPATVDTLGLVAAYAAQALDRAAILKQKQFQEAIVQQRHTHLQRAYEFVTAERRTLAAVLDSANDAVLVTDEHGVMRLGNPAVERVLGVHPDTLLGQPLRDTDVPGDLIALVERARANAGGADGELRLANGCVYHVSIAPVRAFDDPVKGYVTLLRDVTHFEQLNEMKNQFVSTVSHDFKTPLNIISSYVELLELDGPLNAEQRAYLRQIMLSVRRLNALVSDLLDLGKIEARVGMQMQPVDLNMLMLTTVQQHRLSADEKRIELVVEADPDLPIVQGDERRLQQVVANLIINAIIYTPAGGNVRVTTSVSEGYAVTRVQDSGIGVSAADLPHIFEPFYRAGAARRVSGAGTGLGLTIVKRIVEEHGGGVGVERALGGGSTFWFALPLDADES